MAYDPNNLSALVYANGFTCWHYKTTDSLQDVDLQDYFNLAHFMLRTGDFIFVNASISGEIENNLFSVVSSTDEEVEVIQHL